jgi:hypothetical protein
MLNDAYKKWHRPNKSGTKAEGGTSQTHQGYYSLTNPNKYIGDPHLIIYRSSWEFSFLKWCDFSPSILRFSSEPIKIPYYDRVSKLDECKKLGLDPNNPRNWVIKNYNVDFWLEIKKSEELIEKWFIEIKPKNKLYKPIPPKSGSPLKEVKRFNMQAKEFLINEAKFAAASEFAKKHGAFFYIFTEYQLTRYGIIGGKFELPNKRL